MNSSPDTTLAFLSALMPAGTAIELRLFRAQFANGNYITPATRYSSTLSGWYDSPQALAVDAMRLRGVSGFITFNPCNPALLARSYNRLAKSTHATKDEDITSLRWLYVDIDPVRPADISSTDAELAAATQRRDAILADHPSLAASSLWGCSGNGAWMLVRLPDLPNDAEHRQQIADALAALSARYSDAVVKVDVSTKNPARVMCLPGTIKCKGSSIDSRPWRLVTLDSPQDKTSEPFNLAGWLETHRLPSGEATAATSKPAPSRSTIIPATGDDTRAGVIFRAARYLDQLAPAVAGQNGHGQTFDAACAAVKGFNLTPEEAKPLLEIWNQRCQPPWTTAELDHKIVSAHERPDDKPRGYLLDASRPNLPPAMGNANPPANLPPGGTPGQPGGPGGGDGDPLCLPGHEENPHRLANAIIRQKYNHPEGVTIRYWRDDFHAWVNGAYAPISDKEIRGRLATEVYKDFERIYLNQLMAAAMKGSDGEDGDDRPKPGAIPKPIPVTTNLVGHVKQALSGIALVDAHSHPDQPCWLDNEPGWPVGECLLTRNSIVHLPSYMGGMPCTRKPTPLLFSPYVLDYDWTPDAPEPTRWLEFLGARPLAPDSPIRYQVWPDDPESIETLQEWMGLNLVPDTSYQKIMAFIGPPRSGKGTIARVLSALIGPANVAGPTLSSLSENFGLESLIGKLAAIIDDARLSGKSDHAVIAERLLSISGEGRLTVGRKYRTDWIGTLPSRITLISNELPRLADSSGALPKRFIVLKFVQSFLGREDPHLTATLLRELPGILLWAIEGWRRLKARGFLQQPDSGAELHQEMEELSSPIGTFVGECLVIGPEEEATVEAVYLAWKQWCEKNSRREPGDQALLGRNLRSVVPSMTTGRKQVAGQRVRIVKGVGLLSAGAGVGTEAAASEYADEAGLPF